MSIESTQAVHETLLSNWNEPISDYAKRVGKEAAIAHFESEVKAKAKTISEIVASDDLGEDDDIERIVHLSQIIAFNGDAIVSLQRAN